MLNICKEILFIWFCISMCCIWATALSNTTASSSNDTCLESDSKTNKSELHQKFTDKQIKWLCQRADSWISAATGRGGAGMPGQPGIGGMPGPPPPLKPSQTKWLNDIRGCKGKKCLTDVVKCTGKQCKEKKAFTPGLAGKPPKGGGAGKPGPPAGPQGAPKPPEETSASTLPFPDYAITADKIASYEIDNVDAKVMLNDSDNIQACEARMWLSNVCSLVLNSTSSQEAFGPTLGKVKGKEKKDRLKKDMDQRYKNYTRKCKEISTVLSKSSKTFKDVKPCGAIAVTQPELDQKAIAERCKAVLNATNPDEAFPDISDEAYTTYSQGLLASSYGEWLQRCRMVQDDLAKNNKTFDDWLHEGDKTNDKGEKVKGKNGEKEEKGKGKGKGRRKRAITDTFSQAWVDPRAYRKEIRMLSDDERQRFFAAVNKLKSDTIDGVSKYDLLVSYHSPQDSPGAHFGPAFLPFHREFLKQMEVALRQVDQSVALPYWDSTLDDGLPTPKDSILWTPDFLGNGDQIVREGPFAYWIATREIRDNPGSRYLYRNVGGDLKYMYRSTNINYLDYTKSQTDFDHLTYCVNQIFEWTHGLAHGFVGGYMGDISVSPNDPAFFLHHCFIDYIWDEFRMAKQSYTVRESDYPADSYTCTQYHTADATMKPFTIKNREGLLNSYTYDLYFYQPRPTCTPSRTYCYSPYLFCDTNKYRCVSKVKPGGDCTGFDGTEICYHGDCIKGKCQAW